MKGLPMNEEARRTLEDVDRLFANPITRKKLEAMIEKGMDSPSDEATPAFWAKLRSQIDDIVELQKQKHKAEKKLDALLTEGLDPDAKQMSKGDWQDIRKKVKQKSGRRSNSRGQKK